MRPPAAVALLVASALLLSGCTIARPAPAPMTQQQKDSAIQAELDRLWGLTGLEGVAPRPQPASTADLTLTEHQVALFDCTNEVAAHIYFDENGDMMMAATGATPTVKEKLDWYSCIADHPPFQLYSAAQLDYIYDYYTDWLVPCLRFHGYAVGRVPTRAEFTAAQVTDWGVWNPFYTVTPPLTSEADAAALEAKCRSTTGGVEGWSR